MSKNRFNPVPSYTPREEKKKEEVVTLHFSNCLTCGKTIKDGYYARWGEGGVCSKSCNNDMELLPKETGEPHD